MALGFKSNLTSMVPQLGAMFESRPQQQEAGELRAKRESLLQQRETASKEYQAEREKIGKGFQEVGSKVEDAGKPVRELSDQLREKLAEPTMTFQPTQQNMDDLMSLFAMTSAAAFLSGGSGRYSGLAALSNLTGALEGYQKGRQDLFKQELQQYDKNIKAKQAEAQRIKDQLQVAQAVYNTNKEEAAGLRKQIEAQLGESEAAYKVRTGDLDAALKLVESDIKTSDRISEKLDQFLMNVYRDRERERAADERLFAGMEQRQSQFEQRMEQKVGGKPLSEKSVQKIEGYDSLARGLEDLKSTFKDEYAGLGVFGSLADLSLELKRRGLGGKDAQGAIAWWAKYQQLQAPNRHALFGATLTGNELNNYRSYTAKPSDSADTIRTMLQNQIDFTKGSARSLIDSFELTGYQVNRVAPRDFLSTYSAPAPVQQVAPTQQTMPSQKSQTVIKLD